MLTRPGRHTPIANVQIAAIFRPCCVWSTPPDVDPQTRVGFSPIVNLEGIKSMAAAGSRLIAAMSPAKVTVTTLKTGESFEAGHIDTAILSRSFA